MSNFLTVQDIARQGLLRLRNNLVTASLVYKDHSNDFAQKGDTISVKVPNTFVAQEFSGMTSPQGITEDKVLVSLDKIATVDVEVSAKEMTLNINDFGQQILNPAMEALAQKIDSDLLGLYVDIPYFSGIAGTTPSALSDFANAAKVLNTNKAPMSMRSTIFDPNATAKFQVLDALVGLDKSGSTDALRNGSIGRVLGLDNYMDQNVKSHVKGTVTAGNATGTAGVKTISLAAVAPSGGTLKKGDLFTIAGDSTQYVVTADVTASTTTVASLAIYPALAVTAAGAAITVVANHAANLAFHKNAFSLVSRPLALPTGGANGYVSNFEGLSIRVTQGYSMSKKINELSFDILYGVKTLQPELAVRVLG
ncbi:P22 phage major capsid protein family protein [Paenibacillus sp. sgz302251]|uniref:P22 phage major capsid protein family protein n=1 Tax=Paenibacillus sp. sgz302251 TaxID=3414493 RepID=UPI003C7DBED6